MQCGPLQQPSLLPLRLLRVYSGEHPIARLQRPVRFDTFLRPVLPLTIHRSFVLYHTSLTGREGMAG